ncbi:MAG: aspartyl protease family protein [Alphaproteobacteria bacterium]|nr:aspartyl protease family protein [Alphaproteobacteria bacterium]
MLSFKTDIKRHQGGGWQPLVPVKIRGRTYKGLVDTGATRSAIKRTLAQSLNLDPVDSCVLETPSHTGEDANLYDLEMGLPRGRSFFVRVVEIAHRQGADVFIGMDIIIQSRLLIRGHRRLLTMSYRRN